MVRLPSVAPDNLQLEIEWTPVAGAVGYRIYRSDSGTGNEEFLADVVDNRYTDTGLPTDPLGLRPLSSGALGEWAAMPALSTPREGPAVSWGIDPVDPSTAYVYAGGGHDGTTALSSIEFLDVTLVDEHNQDAGVWTTSANTLQNGRYLGAGYRATPELNTSVFPGETWIYFGMGHTAAGGASSNIEAGLIDAGGELTAFQNVFGASNRAGHGAALASDFVYASAAAAVARPTPPTPPRSAPAAWRAGASAASPRTSRTGTRPGPPCARLATGWVGPGELRHLRRRRR